MLPKRKAHADHNHALCLHLHTRGGTEDWVVTTAFYAALHYALAATFPFTETVGDRKVEHESFDAYVSYYRFDRERHRRTRELIERRYPAEVAARYNRLLDLSWASRYREYQQDPAVAQAAVRTLELLRRDFRMNN